MDVSFTTRPEIQGSFGAVCSTHWIASAVGMGILERGGNAFDAAVATGLVLQVVEPHLNGPGGELPVIFSVRGGAPLVICAQGTAPAQATIERYRAEGLSQVPGSGFLATVVPGAFDGWMLLLRDYGTLPLQEILAPAIHYAEAGHPVLPRVANTIAGLADFFFSEWPSSAAAWMPNGAPPAPGTLFANPRLAATWKRILRECTGARGREMQINAARDAFYRGFVAEEIDRFARIPLMDASGRPHAAVLTADDMATWSASLEPSLSGSYGGWEIHKTGPWGQGPVLLQALNILRHAAISEMTDSSTDFVHTVAEAVKLAMADREAYYGDPAHFEIPLDTLLSDEYSSVRAELIGADASLDQRPGRIAGFEALADRSIVRAKGELPTVGIGTGEPTMSHLAEDEGDTVHLDVMDRWGNVVSATPSGGWLQSSPVIPSLGFPLNSRAQMFWLEEGLPTSLAPGRRPRTTLSPSLARHRDGRILSVGTPGGDQQDQWQLIFFLRHVHGAMNLQANLDAPLFFTSHFPSSFAPRAARPGTLIAEETLGADVLEALRARGHAVEVTAPWTIGRLTCAERRLDGRIRAAATPRLMQAYAVGR